MQPGFESPGFRRAGLDTLDPQAQVLETPPRRNVFPFDEAIGSDTPTTDLIVHQSKLFFDDETLRKRSDDAAHAELYLAAEHDLRLACQQRDRAHLLEIDPRIVAAAFRLARTDFRSRVGHSVSGALATHGDPRGF